MRRLVGYFLQGFIYIAPLGAALYVVYRVFTLVDAPLSRVELMVFEKRVPGLGIATVVALLTLLGWLGSTIIARPFKTLTRKVLERAPLIGTIEGAVRELLSALFAKERRFKQPVLVRLGGLSDLEKVGFITQNDLRDLGLGTKVAVYFPHSYNFSGELFIVPAERVRPLAVSAREAMKFIVSGGMIHFADRREVDAGRAPASPGGA